MAPPSWISVNVFVNVRLRRENTGAKPERGTLPQAMSKEAYCAFLSAVPSSKHTHTLLRTFSLFPPSSSIDALVQPIDNGPKEKERRKQLRNPLPPLFTLASFVNLCKVRERVFGCPCLSKECGTTNISAASFPPPSIILLLRATIRCIHRRSFGKANLLPRFSLEFIGNFILLLTMDPFCLLSPGVIFSLD